MDVSHPIVLEVQALSVAAKTEAGKIPLVTDVSFSLKSGDILAIAGESGSGKSITSLALMGLLPESVIPTGGSIKILGNDLSEISEFQKRQMRGKQIAMIFQEPMTSLNPVMSIGWQLIEAIREHERISLAKARRLAVDALTSVRISQPEKRLKQYPHQLSGGMRQRVMIAMALALKPAVLIADEPTTALDVTVQREILDLLRDLQKETGTAIILITHDMGVVAEMAQNVIIMRYGKIVERGNTVQIFNDPQAQYTKELLQAVPRIGKHLLTADEPKKIQNQLPKPVAALNDVFVRFGIRGGVFGRVVQQVHAVEKVSFNIMPGETFALVGESGCGKSTIAKAIVGLVPYTGTIEIFGQNPREISKKDYKALRRKVQIVFQDPMAALDSRMRIGDLLEEPLIIHKIGTRNERRATCAMLMERVGLSADQLNRYPHEFSGGQRQRICIARALILEPNLIIADESVSALDVSVQAQVLDLLNQLKEDLDISYLFISHDMAVVENIADRVGVMYLGQIVEMGSRDQIFSNPVHPYTKSLLDAVPVPDPLHVHPPFKRFTEEVPSPIYKIGETPVVGKLTDVGQGHLVMQ